MSTPHPLQTSHETFVPREIIYDLWSAAEHLEQWNPALAAASLIAADPPERLAYRVAANGGEAAELEVVLTDVDGTTRIDVKQSSSGNPSLPHSTEAWQDLFHDMENYLSAI